MLLRGPWLLWVAPALYLALRADVAPQRPDRLRVQGDGVWLGWGPFEVEGRLEDASVVWSFLCVPVIRLDDRVVRFAVWPDSADADALRRLRTYLLWHPGARDEKSDESA